MMVKTAGTQRLTRIAARARETGLQTRLAQDVIDSLAPYAGHVLAASEESARIRDRVQYYQVTAQLKNRKGKLVKVRMDVLASDWHRLPDLSL